MAAAATVLCALGIIALIWGIMQKFKAGRLAKAPFVKTGDAADKGDTVAGAKGAISVEGAVTCDQPLISPVTGTPCLYYELKVVGSWKDGDQKKTKDYVDEKSAAAFVVDDGSGAVIIAAGEGGDFDPLDKTFEETKKEGLFADLKSAVGKGKPMMFDGYAFENPPMSKANKFTCTEKVLKPQDKLFVLGKHQEGVIASPSWTSLIISSRGREELLGATAKAAKRFLIGGAAAAAVGLVLGIVSSLTATPATAADEMAAATATDEATVEVGKPVAEIAAAPNAICAKAMSCCEAANGRGAGKGDCASLTSASESTCRSRLAGFKKFVKRTKPARLSACR